MDTHLNGVVACITGDLTHDANDNQWTYENLKRWLELRGGKLVDLMGDSVTHLICSQAAFEARTDKVEYTQREECKCKLVTYEWLADAILLYDQLKRKAPTHLYHPGNPRPNDKILDLYKKNKPNGSKDKAQTDPAVRSSGKKKGDGSTTEKRIEDQAVVENRQPSNAAENGRKGDEKPTENKIPGFIERNPKASKKGTRRVDGKPRAQTASDIGRIYKDPTDGFEFNVNICGSDRYGNPRGTRWLLRIFEQVASPRLYKFDPRFLEKEGAQPRPCGHCSYIFRPKELAMKEFEDFFLSKTGLKWEDRLLKSGERQRGNKFTYYAPAPGEPVGYIPSKYMPGKSGNTKSRGRNDYSLGSVDARKHVPSLKRKRDDTVESKLAKAARATNKRTAAFDDVSIARASRL